MLEIEPVRPETEALTIRANLALLDVPADGDIALDLAGRRLGEAWDPACGCTVDGLEVEFESAILALDTQCYDDVAVQDVTVHLAASACEGDGRRLAGVHVFQNGLRGCERCWQTAEAGYVSAAVIGPAPSGQVNLPAGPVPFLVTADLTFSQPWIVGWPISRASAN